MNENFMKIFLAVGSYIIAYAFGGWNDALSFLCFLVALDCFTGLSAAYYEGKKHPNDSTKGLNSNRGFWGILKKVLMFTVIAVLYRVDQLLGLEGNLSLMVGATFFYLGNELISLAENYGRMDLPMPEQMKKAIAVLKGKSEVAEHTENQ
ncbi:phage holin family protein [Paenibacillus sp. 7124]|uniref:Phage holin family protein n=1 Tax=Paenibacillus apii TaxID=1850370 RepID=A0A6M1PH28_9BACL|nr:phage holin family protein [Paenibacillus apii]NGM81273.1 phage holin family protein [Paenibacillus apii]